MLWLMALADQGLNPSPAGRSLTRSVRQHSRLILQGIASLGHVSLPNAFRMEPSVWGIEPRPPFCRGSCKRGGSDPPNLEWMGRLLGEREASPLARNS